MNEHLTPEKIYNGVINGEISRNLAQSQLISLIEGSNVPTWRSEAIDLIKKLDFREIEIFRIVESALLSDENTLVRNSAADLICTDFLNDGLNSLIWVLVHEKSPLILNIIFKLMRGIAGSTKERLNHEFHKIFIEISKKVGISESEAPFILELESLFAKNQETYIINLNSYACFKLLRDSKWEEPWLKIQDNHIISLTLNLSNWNYIRNNLEQIESILKIDHLFLFLESLQSFNVLGARSFKIPESIEYLSFLKTLDISNNNVTQIPESIGKLAYLKKLNLRSNKLTKIPEAIFNPSLLKIFRFKR